MKALKIAIIVLVFGVIGYGAYWYVTKKKGATAVDANGEPILTPPPTTATPPINSVNSLQPTSSGAGLAAIERRINELLSSSVSTEIQDQVRASVDILKGVKDSKKSYYNQNISRPPITSAKNVPFKLSLSQKSALSAFDGIDASGNANIVEPLRVLNSQLKDAIGTCFVGDPELQNDLSFAQQVVCQGYQNCGKNYKDMSTAKIKAGSGQAGTDMKKMAAAWLAGSNQFDSLIRGHAIQDLRDAGWKFEGFDHL